MLLRDRGVALRARVKIFDYVQHALRRQVLSLERVDEVDYLQRASRCKTQNQFNQLHIWLEGILTPRELARLSKLAKRSNCPEPSRLWLKKIRKLVPKESSRPPQGYQRLEFTQHVTLYQNPKRDSRDKGLLVAFTGNARRLMMPIPVFLQFVDAQFWDVLLLKKCARNSYLLGIEGISTDFRGLIDYIETTTSAMQHRSVITLGASGGGFSAIWAAVLMRATRGICVCGSPPSSLPSLIKRAPNGPDLCFVYGEDCVLDHHAALTLVDLFGGRLRPIAEIDEHGALAELLKRGQFANFIAEMLA